MAGLKVKIGADASQFERTMRGVKKQVGGVKSSILGIAGAVGAIWAVNKAFDAMKSAARLVVGEMRKASEAASGFEMMSTQFEVLTGSADVASDLMATFRKEAQKSSLTIEDWASSAKTMLAFGADASTVVDAMKTIGDVSMGNSERFKFMTIAFAQVQAAGRLMGQEVRQMVNAGFNPLQQISERTGESMGELKKRMEDGLIPFSEVEQAFKDATSAGGRFYKAIDRGSDTFEGKMNQAKDAVFGLRLSFGEGFNEGLKDVLDATSNFLPQFEKKMASAGKTVGTAISDAVNGDLEMFSAIGQLVGTVIKRGIEIAMTEAKGGAAKGIFKWLEHGGFKSGGVLPKGFTERMGRGQEIEKSGQAVDFMVDFKSQLAEVQRLSREAQARRASKELGLGGEIFTPAPGGGMRGSQQLQEDVAAMRRLFSQMMRRANSFTN